MAIKNTKDSSLKKRWLRRFRIVFVAMVGLLVVKLLWMLIFAQSGEALLNGKAKRDLLSRRDYLLSRFHGNAFLPENSPSFLADLFRGEWAVGLHSMTALSLAQIAFIHPDTMPQARREIDAIIASLLQTKLRAYDRNQWWGKDPLEDLKEASRGHVGYLGHLNLALAARVWLGDAPRKICKLHREVTLGLARAMSHHGQQNAETYPRQFYIMDNAAAAASIALFDRAFPDEATGAAKRWLDWCNIHARDEKTGLLGFEISKKGRILQGARGSGAAWNVFFISFIDLGEAQAEFGRIRKHLLKDFPMGLSAIAEFPPGKDGFSDVDSGPVLLGMSTSGTGFAVAGARLTKSPQLLGRLLRTGEFFGFTIEGFSGRRYLIAPLVGDAILLAMKTAVPWELRWLRNH